MKKILIILTVLVLGLIAIFYNDYDNDKVVLTNNSNSQIINSNSLTMMYETDYQSGKYQVSSDTSWPQDGYTFNERLSKCENGGVLSWDDENKKVLLQTNTSDKCFIYFDKEPEIIYLADYIINNVYTGTDGDNSLYYHDGIGEYTNADQEAGDNSYRYSGTNPNNYVCFGSDEEVCPEYNLYRIIGVFDNRVKLIKNTSIGNYFWDSDEVDFESIAQLNNHNSNYYLLKLKGDLAVSDPSLDPGKNDWKQADLNYYLNNDYFWNTLTSSWQNKIATHSWIINKHSNSEINAVSVKEAYLNEIMVLSAITQETKIGLMYVSDYGYSASPNNWNTNMSNLNNDENINNN